MHVIIHLSKPTEWTTPRVSPNVNCGLWMEIMCPCNTSPVTTDAPLWWEMLITGQTASVGVWHIRSFSVLSSQFCYEPKTAIKKLS